MNECFKWRKKYKWELKKYRACLVLFQKFSIFAETFERCYEE